MRPDFSSTVTGWAFTDRLTAPLWAVWCWWGRRRLYSTVGRGDRQLGKVIFLQAVRESVEGGK